jgi:pimeloyl-ACP methyl ester carboxylesterase
VRRELHALRVRHPRHEQRWRAVLSKRTRRAEERQEQEDQQAETHDPTRSVPASHDDSVIEIVLVHSGVTDSGEWDGVRPLLEHEHLVFAPDLPGFGTTPEVPGELSLSEYVLSVFDGPAALVGTSFGGRAVLETALAAPERVTHLVLIGANPFGWSDDVQRVQAQEGELFEAGRLGDAAELMARSWLAGPDREPDEVDAELYDRVRRMNLRAYELQAGEEGSLRKVEIEPERITAPTLVVRGALDWPDIAAAAQRLVDELPNARLVVVEGCAHLPTMERPDEVARLILDFVA